MHDGQKTLGNGNVLDEGGRPGTLPKTDCWDDLIKAFDHPSDHQVNVTTTLPVNIKECIDISGLKVKYLIMRGIQLERLLVQMRERIEEQRAYKESWKHMYMRLKEKVGHG